MSRLTGHRKQQLQYVAADILSSVMVWLCFLLFRWMVFEGKTFGLNTVLVPAFDFYQPLIIYPAACLLIYYLSGYYLRPRKHSLTREMLTTLISAAIISIGAFFVIIIDDRVTDYHNYLGSLLVLFILQFFLSWLMRLAVTLLSRRNMPEEEVVLIDLPENASEYELFAKIKEAYPSGKEIVVRPRVKDILTGAARIYDLQGEALIRITDHHASDSALCIKRAFDILVSALTLLVLSPLYALIALLIRLSSNGPALYRQERIGLHGIPFNILKFRTMRTHAENDIPQLASTDDPRITPLGHFLRKYRIDELPQMWNVLKGDMSIVGPRPERAYFIKLIEEKAPYYCLIYKIRPGLTSWGPIKVGYTDTVDKMVQRLNYDIAYMENMSLLLDIKIMWHTIAVIFGGKGK